MDQRDLFSAIYIYEFLYLNISRRKLGRTSANYLDEFDYAK